MADRLRLAVLISGSGSNLQAIVDRVAVGDLDCEIALVISNRADAYGLQRAAAAGIATRVIDHRSHNGRESFDAAAADDEDPAGGDPSVSDPTPEVEESADAPEDPSVTLADLQKMKYRDMQALARSEGVNASGKRTELLARLKDHFDL